MIDIPQITLFAFKNPKTIFYRIDNRHPNSPVKIGSYNSLSRVAVSGARQPQVVFQLCKSVFLLKNDYFHIHCFPKRCICRQGNKGQATLRIPLMARIDVANLHRCETLMSQNSAVEAKQKLGFNARLSSCRRTALGSEELRWGQT